MWSMITLNGKRKKKKKDSTLFSHLYLRREKKRETTPWVTFSPALLSPKFLCCMFFYFQSHPSLLFDLILFCSINIFRSWSAWIWSWFFLFCFGYSRLEQKISMSKSAIKLMREDRETFNKLMVDKEGRLNNKIHSIILLKACLISQ